MELWLFWGCQNHWYTCQKTQKQNGRQGRIYQNRDVYKRQGLAYLSGIADAGWTAIGLAIGTYLNWKIVAKRIRLYTHVAGNSITLPSFFSNRFRDNRHLLQSIGAIFIVIFFIPYTASGFAACGKLFSSLFGVKYLTAMIISALVIVGDVYKRQLYPQSEERTFYSWEYSSDAQTR